MDNYQFSNSGFNQTRLQIRGYYLEIANLEERKERKEHNRSAQSTTLNQYSGNKKGRRIPRPTRIDFKFLNL
ncbi:hypothetical protein AO498_13575 [Algoriphagus sanaruensis]|uniref:Uncharacterized protein n=1 Tax=Algoriphagus sanaruensis TaxID=1727163 RepID=A0A142EQR8_9BACT|nr:hypothetical protein AO498_13575 [Algoriphagus sanaruensis]